MISNFNFIRNKKRKYRKIKDKNKKLKIKQRNNRRIKHMYILIWQDDSQLRVYSSKSDLYTTIRFLERNHTNYYKKEYHYKKYFRIK